MSEGTIVAPITGSPPAAVAIVRLSGPESWSIASQIFAPWPDPVTPRMALYGRLCSGEDALVIPFTEGASFTGEESVEFNIHGSRAGIEALLGDCLSHGARMARPGEFSERAVMNGKLDLTQAEAIRDLIEAQTERQMKQANLVREGALGNELASLQKILITESATLDAHVDFSEEIGDYDKIAAVKNLALAQQKVERLLSTADAGRFLRKGVRIVLAGRPNAGKSSLLNTLLGRDRTIVSALPGTTRDYIEEQVELGGALCTLVDTAGVRESVDEVETEGIRRTRELAAGADLVAYLYDSTKEWSPEDEVFLDSLTTPVIIVANKCDLGPQSGLRNGAIEVSATTGTGLDELTNFVEEFSGTERALEEPLIRERHEIHLRKAAESLSTAIATLSADIPYDLAAVSLQAALAEIGAITGSTASEDAIAAIFSEFCIGK